MFDVYPTNPELASVDMYSIKTKTDFLKKHFEIIENVFEDESKSLSELCQKENEKTKNDDDDHNYDYRYSDSLMEIEFVYLRMHRYTSILAAYSYLESSMSIICHQKKLELDLSISAEELKGDGIVKYQKYLEKICKSDFSSINKLWSDLATLNKVRNCIMHCSGDASKINGHDAFIKLVNNTKELSFIEKNIIMISSKFVLDSIKNITDFLDYLIQKK